MKKTYFLLSLVGLALAANVEAAQSEPFIATMPRTPQLQLQPAGAPKQFQLETSDVLITNAEGEERLYVSTCYFSAYWQWQFSNDFAARVSFGSDNSVYINDLMPIVQTGWLKGTLGDDGIVTFEGAQLVDSGNGKKYYVGAVKMDEEKNVTYLDQYQFKLSSDSNKLTLATDSIYLAAFDEKGNIYQLQYGNELNLLNDTTVDFPAGLRTQPYTYTCLIDEQDYSGQVYLALDEPTHKAYLKGLVKDADAWVVGKYDGKHIKLGSRQFLGLNHRKISYFFAGKRYGDNYSFSDTLYLNYDETTKALSAYATQMILNGSSNQDPDLFAYRQLAFENIDAMPAVPASPTNVAPNASGKLQFVLPLESADGKAIVKDSLYYRIQLDGQSFEFTPDAYPGLETNTTLIPCGYMLFDSFGDMLIGQNLDYNVVALPEYERVGVQSVYIYDGVENSSPYVEYVTADISHATQSDIVRREYFNLSGLKVEPSVKGLVIVRETLSDGTQRVRKLLLR
ncbi:MAG: hypothetical protein ACOYJG_05230 [Prevotella sp.]|jgi:hypothetical protein